MQKYKLHEKITIYNGQSKQTIKSLFSHNGNKTSYKFIEVNTRVLWISNYQTQMDRHIVYLIVIEKDGSKLLSGKRVFVKC